MQTRRARIFSKTKTAQRIGRSGRRKRQKERERELEKLKMVTEASVFTLEDAQIHHHFQRVRFFGFSDYG